MSRRHCRSYWVPCSIYSLGAPPRKEIIANGRFWKLQHEAVALALLALPAHNCLLFQQCSKTESNADSTLFIYSQVCRKEKFSIFRISFHSKGSVMNKSLRNVFPTIIFVALAVAVDGANGCGSFHNSAFQGYCAAVVELSLTYLQSIDGNYSGLVSFGTKY
jgi:hypothetical protein